MGLSSKQVSSDEHGWNQSLLQNSTLELSKPPSMNSPESELLEQEQQQEQQQSEPLKCPRCDSTNTKFCYYNNYNKLQPRHFCKACKRHWTKGGNLRNIPAGGGRKNKRRSKVASKIIKTAPITTARPTINDNIQGQQQQQPEFSLPLGAPSLGGSDEKNAFTEAFYQTVVTQPPSSMSETSITNNNKSFNDGIFLNNNDLQIPDTNLGNFENNPSSISPSNFYNYTGDQANGLEETVINSLNNTSSSSMSGHQQPWTTSTTSTSTTATYNIIDMTSNWDWAEFDKLVSGEAGLSMVWDDTEIKPCP